MKSPSPYTSLACMLLLLSGVIITSCDSSAQEADTHEREQRLQILFLGDDGGHEPSVRLRDIARPMLDRGIELFYTSDLNDINLENLRKYDAVLHYANYHEPDYPQTDPKIIESLISYVEEGGGYVPVHSASGNFRDSDEFISLLGGAFESHESGTFRTRIAEPDHEIMQGFEGFESWDETYVHQQHNEENRTVLSYRDDEPWTWIRTQGDGRVFYTVWGHDERTWQNEGFHDLLERGIRWAAGEDVQNALENRTISNPFTYDVLDVPFPPPHEERLRYEEEVGTMDRGANNPRYYQKQKPLDPVAAMDRMILQPGYRVELFASEPDIVNPIFMNWDEQGRLWVIESIEYPYPRDFWPDGGGKDRILILEDTNGDGKADEFTVFADSLNIPTSLAFSDGGVIVHQAPQTLFLKDTTGDGKADVREVLFEGWEQWDTHAGPNNLYYGLDNQFWGVLGYAGMDGVIGGEHHEFRMGVYRFLKDGTRLEFLQRTNNNTWGLGFNEQGDAFISTANGNPSTLFTIPQRFYRDLDGLDDSVTDRLASTVRVITLTNLFRQVDWVGAFTSAAGHGVYTARTWPGEYWNRKAFVTEPTVQLVAEMDLIDNGSSYHAEYNRNLIASDDEWFSPIQAEVGPDGHIWVTDWYNYIIQHNAESDRQEPTPGNAYANPLRDRQHGRIYRIVYEENDHTNSINLAGASPGELIETLSHDNLGWRKHAQRLLVERGQTDIVPDLIDLIKDQSIDDADLNPAVIHAMWTLHGLGQLAGSNEEAIDAVVGALSHPSAGVRQNAVQVLPLSPASADAILDGGLLRDNSLQVRLKTLNSLSDMPPSERVGEEIFRVFQDSENIEDRWIREAAAISARIHGGGFIAAASQSGYSADDYQVDEEDPVGSFESIIAFIADEAPAADRDRRSEEPSVEVDIELELGVTPNVLEFDKDELRVQAGQTVRVVFTNTDNMEHNLLFILPGTLADVGELADQMMASPEGRSRAYVPETPDVIAYTPILDPGERYELVFTVPDEPGEYPFVCTIPGHWRIMNGILVVE
ncbi:PVC-type heme-binding CxxCH protein [Rhodohalobacter sp. SW132]|uniref:PVC-type heme-binding CxxCH protein n=1 Tax=Rhodohalobacter sp. SW132 TaxID=2293433 RepID=UPI0013155F23|nr:PVC-type heme-binding CxxCH protein [Rhodohalobacter sp. SW132]